MFIKYPHIERFGTDEVQDIEIGKCYIFPKIDGSNGSLWFEENNLMAGSRNRQLSLDRDNSGFMRSFEDNQDERHYNLLKKYPGIRLYGEWLVPHSLKTYREDAWNKFYIFDVYNDQEQRFLSYEEYQSLLEEFRLDYIPCQKIITNPTLEHLIHEVQHNFFLIQEGQRYGEGIVVKRYDYKNKFGRTTWAKLIANSFKEQHQKSWKPNEFEVTTIESEIVEHYVTTHLVDKVVEKIRNQKGSFESKDIPQLLGITWHDLVTEELWEIIKFYKNPKIDFKLLNRFTIGKIKQLRPELF